jgi:hypothetical protein
MVFTSKCCLVMHGEDEEQHRMATPSKSHNNERPSTYFVQDRHSKEDLTRLIIQDQMLTTSMGGVLPEQTDPTIIKHSIALETTSSLKIAVWQANLPLC